MFYVRRAANAKISCRRRARARGTDAKRANENSKRERSTNNSIFSCLITFSARYLSSRSSGARFFPVQRVFQAEQYVLMTADWMRRHWNNQKVICARFAMRSTQQFRVRQVEMHGRERRAKKVLSIRSAFRGAIKW